jgi:uncharacterized membrane protein YGL010W
MANDFFRRQLGMYASVHRDARNKATHFIGIPMIVFSMLLTLTQWQLEIAGHHTSAAAVLAVISVLGWMTLDLGVGLGMAAVMLVTWYAAEALAGALGLPSAVWIASVVFFVAGWILQFLGHHFEGRRPALIDNLFQAFIGPMFLVAEIMVVNGYRHDLAKCVAQGDVSTL